MWRGSGPLARARTLSLAALGITLMVAMWLRPRRRERHLNAGFDWREIVCDSEAAAKAEVERQQNLDDRDEAEWIYLRRDTTGEWLARRTPRQLEVPGSSFDPEAGWWVQWPTG